MNNIPEKVVLIGSGNVATRLGLHFKKKGISINHVYSRNIEHAKALAGKVNSTFGDSLDSLPAADLYLICVNDSAIEHISSQLIISTNSIVAHTSGTVSLNELIDHERRAIIYPLQTLKSPSVDMDNIPFLLEASSPALLGCVKEFVAKFSNTIIDIDSENRAHIHLAAVFANNFTNHMLSIAYDILKEKKIDPKILLPLIRQTFNALASSTPDEAQTGPAKRNDTITIENHLKLLSGDYKKIYESITASIQHKSNHEH